MLWRLPLKLFWWLFGGLIRTVVVIALLFGLVYLAMRLTPLDEFWKARLYSNIGNAKEAEKWYNLGLQQHPNSRFAPQGHYELGNLLFAQKRYKEARGHLSKALEGKLPPELKRDILLKVAESFQKDGQPLEAAKRFEKFANTFPEDERTAKGLFLAGNCYRQANQPKDAERCWQKVSGRYPSSPFSPKALWELAELKEEQSEQKSALQLYRKLIERYPKSPEAAKANARIAVWHYRQGNYKEALQAYGDALKAAPKVLQDALTSENLKKLWQRLKESASSLLQPSP